MNLFSALVARAGLASLVLLPVAPAFAAPPVPAPGTPAVNAPVPVTNAPATPAGEPVAQRGTMKLTAEDVRNLVQRADPAVRAQILANPAALSEFVRDRLQPSGCARHGPNNANAVFQVHETAGMRRKPVGHTDDCHPDHGRCSETKRVACACASNAMRHMVNTCSCGSERARKSL